MFKKINWWKLLVIVLTGITLGIAKLETWVKAKADAKAKEQLKEKLAK